MFIIMFLRWLFGWVEFTASEGFPERFVNLCSNEEIPLWNMKRECGTITAGTMAQAYRHIKVPAVKSGMRLKIKARHGLPFFLHKYRRRSGVLGGFIIFIVTLSLLSNVVWSIEISGNYSVPDERILQVIDRAGIKIGTIAKNVDAKAVRLYALSELSEVSYIAVNVIGATVQIEVTERVDNPSIIAAETPCDIVAAEDGQLALIEGYRGTKVKRKGEAVRKGETLVSGIVEQKDKSNRFMHAEGYAVIRSEKKIAKSVDAEQEILVLADSSRRIKLVFFGFTLPTLPFPKKTESWETHSDEKWLEISGVRLPFGYVEETRLQKTKKERRLTENELALKSCEKYFAAQSELLENAVLLQKSVSAKLTENSAQITSNYLIERSGGVAREMLFE